VILSDLGPVHVKLKSDL